MNNSDFACEFHVVSDKKDRHPLHLQVHDNDFNILFGKVDDVSKIVALDRCQTDKSATKSPRLFAVVEKTDLEFGSDRQADSHPPLNHESTKAPILEDGHVKQAKTVVYCSQQFLTHYGFSVEDAVFLRPVHIFPLQKIVVGVASDQALAWAKNKFFSTGLLLSVCQQKVLVRQNDVFLAPNNTLFSHGENFDMSFFFDMKVISCEPMQQGRLAVNTEIVIINQTNKNNQCPEQSSCQQECKEICSATSKLDNEPFVLSDFAITAKGDEAVSTIVKPSTVNEEAALDGNVEKFLNSRAPVFVLETSNLESSAQMRSILKLTNDESGNEILDTVGLSEKTICELGLFDGSLAEVEVDTSTEVEKGREGSRKNNSEDGKKNKSKPKAKRIVKVHAVQGKTVRDFIAYMSPGLCFNICQKAFKHTSFPSIKIVIKVCLGRDADDTNVDIKTQLHLTIWIFD